MKSWKGTKHLLTKYNKILYIQTVCSNLNLLLEENVISLKKDCFRFDRDTFCLRNSEECICSKETVHCKQVLHIWKRMQCCLKQMLRCLVWLTTGTAIYCMLVAETARLQRTHACFSNSASSKWRVCPEEKVHSFKESCIFERGPHVLKECWVLKTCSY